MFFLWETSAGNMDLFADQIRDLPPSSCLSGAPAGKVSLHKLLPSFEFVASTFLGTHVTGAPAFVFSRAFLGVKDLFHHFISTLSAW